MRRPLLIAAVLTLALVAWLASRPLEQLMRGEPVALEPMAPAAAPVRPLASVRVRLSEAVPIEPVLTINGRTAPARTVQLKAETSGQVVETPVREGQEVVTGAVVLRLELRDRDSLVRQAEAWVAQRQLEYEAARRLGEKQFQAQTRVAEALAELEEARAILHEARLDRARIELRAPFAGVLEARMVEIGDYVEVGDAVAQLNERDPILVVGDAPETMARHFAVGQSGVARLADGTVVEGRIRFVATEAHPGTRTFRVELEVPDPERRLVAGMSARLEVALAPVEAHRVSAGVLVLSDAGEVGIMAVDGAGIVRFHPAEMVRAEADFVWLGGLPQRLDLVTVGQGFVAAGEKVTAQRETPT